MRFYLIPLAALWLASPALAEPQLPQLELGVGVYDLIDDETTGSAQISYRWAPIWWHLRPLVGGMVSAEGTIYGFGGFMFDVPVLDNIAVRPSLVAGLLDEGDGKNLGSPVEFRSGVEFAYQLENHHDIALGFYHISNAGLTERNPGTEILSLSYVMPFAP